jgi:dGTPase
MQWDKLLSKKRYFGPVEGEIEISRPVSEFQLDAERILYTSSFRRLQGKTQVYPLPIYDYLRTRLTHTNEVSFVGKVIARNVANGLRDFNPEWQQDVVDIVYAACLAHDLGNPPFGHIGEDAIQTWFRRQIENNSSFKKVLEKEEQKSDFLSFDGNAQSFRIATRLSSHRERGGMRLSYATLGAFSKYPWGSAKADKDKKKFGYMYADRGAAEEIYDALGMKVDDKHERHPLAYIVEAADDVSYLTTDIDDAHRMKRINLEFAEGLLLPICKIGGYANAYEPVMAMEEQDRVSFLRSCASAALIKGVIAAFKKNEDGIMNGTFQGNLIQASDFAVHAKTIREACTDKIYTEPNKIQIEAAGFHIILKLMDIFGEMIANLHSVGEENKLDRKDKNLIMLLPKESRLEIRPMDMYKNMLILVDYISGMTDRFALDLHQRLTGTSPALGRMA